MSANELFIKAENMSKQSIVKIFTGLRLDESAEIFVRSGNLYKAESQIENAMKSYDRAVDCYMKLHDNFNAANVKEMMAKIMARTQPEIAAEILCDASKLIIGESLSKAANYLRQAAELYDKNCNNEMALQCYNKTLEYCDIENIPNQTRKILTRVAEIYAEAEKYDDAIHTYDRLIKECAENNLLRFSIKDYCHMALLCIACKNDVIGVEKKLMEYCQLDTAFENSYYYKFINDILAAWNDNDLDKFTQIVFEFDNLHKLERLSVTLLLRIKKCITVEQLI